jgi:hypothetical protein
LSQADCDAGTNVLWRRAAMADGTWQIINVNTGKCLDVNGASTLDGAVVQQWSCWGGKNQAWSMDNQAVGCFNRSCNQDSDCCSGSSASSGPRGYYCYFDPNADHFYGVGGGCRALAPTCLPAETRVGDPGTCPNCCSGSCWEGNWEGNYAEFFCH